MRKEAETGPGPHCPYSTLLPHSPRLLTPPSRPLGLLHTEHRDKILRGALGWPRVTLRAAKGTAPRADPILTLKQASPLGLT